MQDPTGKPAFIHILGGNLRLFSLTLMENGGEWIWYALLSVAPYLDGYVVLAPDKTRKSLPPLLGDKLFFQANPGSFPEGRQIGMDKARQLGATHLLLLGPDQIHPTSELMWCRRLLQETEILDSQLQLPPRQHAKRHDPEPTDGVLVRHLAVRAIQPSEASPAHGGLESGFQVNWLRLEGLQVGRQGEFLEPTGERVEDSPWRLKLPTTHFWDFSSLSESSQLLPPWVKLPEALCDPKGPEIGLLSNWRRQGLLS